MHLSRGTGAGISWRPHTEVPHCKQAGCERCFCTVLMCAAALIPRTSGPGRGCDPDPHDGKTCSHVWCLCIDSLPGHMVQWQGVSNADEAKNQRTKVTHDDMYFTCQRTNTHAIWYVTCTYVVCVLCSMRRVSWRHLPFAVMIPSPLDCTPV